MSVEYQAADVKAPNDLAGPDDDFQVRKFDCDMANGANALPGAWNGKYVRLYNEGPGVVYFAVSKRSAAEVDSTVAATAAGASLKVGSPLAVGAETHRRLPAIRPDETLYFVREASVDNTVVYVELSSG
jgi:hypothetical protein